LPASGLSRASGVLLLGAMLAACASAPMAPPADTVSELDRVIASQDLTDGRGRFREVFCTVLGEHGRAQPDFRSCDQALRALGTEAGSTGKSISLEASRSDYMLLMVPGLGWDCFQEWLHLSGSISKHAAAYGYDVREIPVNGLSSSTYNARLIRDFINALPTEDAGREIVLIGYSNGTPDILEALHDYPELADRVAAVVSLSGAVRGSPLATDASQAMANMLTMVPGAKCEEDDGDNEAVTSLQPEVRQRWMATRSLPGNIRYYSVITYPEPEQISRVLKRSYARLSAIDPRNDSQIIIFDQILPRSTLVAFVNADHWAIAVPIAREHGALGKTLVNHNDFPREAFMEALFRYVEEDLAAGAR
jgi:pimeloyl-ACP methyl ester carboxylesterase